MSFHIPFEVIALLLGLINYIYFTVAFSLLNRYLFRPRFNFVIDDFLSIVILPPLLSVIFTLYELSLFRIDEGLTLIFS